MTTRHSQTRTFGIISATLLALSTLSGLAQTPRVPPTRPGAGADQASPEAIFQHFDVNGDGKLSIEEAPEHLAQNFDRFDLNKDGFITLREFNAARSSASADNRPPRPLPTTDQASVEAMFQRLDVNGDGKLSIGEAPERLAQNFDRFDLNKDGFITLREFNAARSSAQANSRPPRPLPTTDQASLEAMFQRFDVNGDGKLSIEEAPERLAQNFDQFDINKDGFITLRELNAARSSAQAKDRPVRPRATGTRD